MANGFMRLLTFGLRRADDQPFQKSKIILPAEDILEFKYPPESRYNQDNEDSEDNFSSNG